jgi:hypothetical protein
MELSRQNFSPLSHSSVTINRLALTLSKTLNTDPIPISSSITDNELSTNYTL